MSRATGVLNRIDKALNKVTPTSRILYKRITTNIGDELIGRITSSTVDSLLSPQPSISQAGRERLTGQRDPVETVITPNGTRLVKDDYVIILSSNAISLQDLQNKNMSFVFKDSNLDEQLFIMDFAPAEFQGVVIIYTVYARSVKV